MWPIIIVVLVVIMLVGPIMMLQPSRSQKRLAYLRKYAATLGLRVSASSVKAPDGDVCWFYWLPLPEEARIGLWYFERQHYEHGLHIAGVWSVTPNSVDAVPGGWDGFLRQMPPSVYAAESNAFAVGVHWTESGGKDTLNAIARSLSELAVTFQGS